MERVHAYKALESLAHRKYSLNISKKQHVPRPLAHKLLDNRSSYPFWYILHSVVQKAQNKYFLNERT